MTAGAIITAFQSPADAIEVAGRMVAV